MMLKRRSRSIYWLLSFLFVDSVDGGNMALGPEHNAFGTTFIEMTEELW